MSEEETSGSFSTRTELELRHQALEMALRATMGNPESGQLTVQRAAIFLAFLQHGTVPTKPENEL